MKRSWINYIFIFQGVLNVAGVKKNLGTIRNPKNLEGTWHCTHHFIEHIFRTMNELKRFHLLIMELKHLNFGFKRTDIEHGTQNLDFLDYPSNSLKHHLFEHKTDSNVFILWYSNTLFLASNSRTSNFEHSSRHH